MEIEKIFKNLILADFIVIILMVISSMYQPSEFSNLYENLNDVDLRKFKNIKLTEIKDFEKKLISKIEN